MEVTLSSPFRNLHKYESSPKRGLQELAPKQASVWAKLLPLLAHLPRVAPVEWAEAVSWAALNVV